MTGTDRSQPNAAWVAELNKLGDRLTAEHLSMLIDLNVVQLRDQLTAARAADFDASAYIQHCKRIGGTSAETAAEVIGRCRGIQRGVEAIGQKFLEAQRFGESVTGTFAPWLVEDESSG